MTVKLKAVAVVKTLPSYCGTTPTNCFLRNGAYYLVTACLLFCRVPFFDHFIQTLLHMLQVFVSYLLMLAFMTYNVWIGLAITLGAGCGYFVFLACLPEDARVSKTSEHCH